MKKIIAFFLWMAVMACLCSGCGSVDSQETTAQTTLAATEPAEETVATEETVPAETGIPVADVNDFRIALITLDSVDPYWKNLATGAMKAAEELGCEVADLSPAARDDMLQAGQIEKAVSEGFDAILVAAVDSEVVTEALKAAMDAGVTVICVDNAADVEADALVCADERAAGLTAGQTMIVALKEQEILEGNIGMISIGADHDGSVQREAGFWEALDGSGYTLLEPQYSGGDAAKAHALTESYMDQDVVGIFCCCEGCTVGAGYAVKESGKKTAIVGFGETEAIIALLDAGDLTAVLVRDPYAVGYEGVKAACAVLHGKDLGDAAVDTGVSVRTK